MGRFQMLVNEWVESFWAVLNVRPKTLHDYKRLYKRHLALSAPTRDVFTFGSSALWFLRNSKSLMNLRCRERSQET